jgi:hypothetical protein
MKYFSKKSELENTQNFRLCFTDRTLSEAFTTSSTTYLVPTGTKDTIHLSFAANDALERKSGGRKKS